MEAPARYSGTGAPAALPSSQGTSPDGGPRGTPGASGDSARRAEENGAAISRPAELMERMRAYVHKHEAHLDGESSSRVLDAVNNYIWYFQGKTRTKPWNLVRKFKLRWRVGYPLMATLRLW